MKKKGFTLVELLVVIAILSFLGAMILSIFTSSLKGSNKSQIISVIKENGQSVLDSMDKNIRNSDRVVCVINTIPPGPTLVSVKQGIYTRYRLIATSQISNGYITQETLNLPSSPPPSSDPNLYVRDFENTVCNDPSQSFQILTDTSTQTGVSADCFGTPPDCNTNKPFARSKSAGFKDQITIKFVLKPGISAPSSVAGQIDPVVFQTSIDLR